MRVSRCFPHTRAIPHISQVSPNPYHDCCHHTPCMLDHTYPTAFLYRYTSRMNETYNDTIETVGCRMSPIHKVDNATEAELNIDIDVFPPSWSRTTTTMADSHLAVPNYPAHPEKLTDTPSPIPVLSDYHRGSISTTRTSLTESSTQDIDEPLVPLPRITSRPRASYKLADFLIQRTLGTGSFGRVHLGPFFVSLSTSFDRPFSLSVTPQYAASTTFAFTPSKS